MRFCIHCGLEVAVLERSCPRCGSLYALSEEPDTGAGCGECARPTARSWRFCASCGEPTAATGVSRLVRRSLADEALSIRLAEDREPDPFPQTDEPLPDDRWPARLHP